jgi:hypothetical protein
MGAPTFAAGYLPSSATGEEFLVRSQMATMGLEDGSDVLAKQTELGQSRELEDQQFANETYDNYERIGLEATPQMINATMHIAETLRQIKEQRLAGRYNEWLQTQPEYSPWPDAITKALGLEGVTTGTQSSKERGSGSSCSIGGGGPGKVF